MPRLLALILSTMVLVGTGWHLSSLAFAQAPGASPSPSAEAASLVDPKSPSAPRMLFDFEGAEAADWSVENDGVMGGRSKGYVEQSESTLVFTGEVVTEGGGFTSVRAPRRVDLSGYDGVELRVRGGGRTFQLDVDDGTRSRGREVSRRGPVPTSDGWDTVRVPFTSLTASAYGEPVRVDPVDRSAIQSIGMYIIDGQDGPFRLEVDWIRAYREAE
ncbi:CIA30 family protein [Salinibacter sp.]|uniref:CIA30 family protein n=1 Tax=Salinibacter sp. TaxID=2065818 RepID=UPI0021E7B49F|nr:CIA30 family protein [Salinibacter sp.]